MTYSETIAYLYSQLPVFHRIGASAYKEGLGNIEQLCTLLNNPHLQFPTIHVAGTNGKGSSSHTLAAILQTAGYKVGLYTSPHLKDFTERIRINGAQMPDNEVVAFVAKYKTDIENIQPSFFEVTVAMAFDHFAQQKVDIAVIEVGMGGRLDSTNIISPLVALITNIGYDHMAFLGDTLPKIASEKAGIIKRHTPVVVSEYQPEIAQVFIDKATEQGAPLYFAKDYYLACLTTNGIQITEAGKEANTSLAGNYIPELKGHYQQKNIAGVLQTITILKQKGWAISPENVREGIANTIKLTGLKGRWQIIEQSPLLVCDVAHNEAGVREVVAQIEATPHQNLHLILAFSNDKDLQAILPLYPQNAMFYFCQYEAVRSMQAVDLQSFAKKIGIQGTTHTNVNEAIQYCQTRANANDLIVVSGSIFLVAEVAGL